MKVRELIEKLSKMNQDAEVVCDVTEEKIIDMWEDDTPPALVLIKFG